MAPTQPKAPSPEPLPSDEAHQAPDTTLQALPTPEAAPAESPAIASSPSPSMSEEDLAPIDDAPTSALTADDFEPRAARVALQRLRAHWPVLTDDERAALDALSTPERRMALGIRTRSIAVAADALVWVGSIDRQLRLYPTLSGHYHPKRFSYFLERTEELVTRVGAQLQLGEARRAAQQGATSGRSGAMAARRRLLIVLRRFAGRRPDHHALIAEAQGAERTDEGLVLSIARLISLGLRWRAEGPSALVETSGLTPQLLSDTRAAGEALATAGALVIEKGTPEGRDTPEVNLVEGWVIEEMIRARADVAEAHREDPRIQRLTGNRGTRHVVGKKRKQAPVRDGQL